MASPCVDLLFVQGASAGAHEADRVLADALGGALGARFRIHFPCLPNEDAPDNDVWRGAISTELQRTQANFLVAHSAGAAITADMLTQRDTAAALTRLHGLLLLAPPFVGAGGWQLDGFHFDTPAAVDALARPPLHLYFGLADTIVPAAHAELYARLFPDAVVHRLPGCGHQFEGWMEQVAGDLCALVQG